MTKEQIIDLTAEYGGHWGVEHTKRLMHLVSVLGEGMEYNEEAVWLAAHLHDWGGYPNWLQPGVDHQLRSVEVAREFLDINGFDKRLAQHVLEIIEYHHGGKPDRSIESILFTDADALDLIGVVGICRVFAMNSRDIRAGYRTARHYRDKNAAIIQTEKGRQMAATRLMETDALLNAFEQETFGMF